MNFKYTLYFTGKIMRIVALMYIVPAITALCYAEYTNLIAFLPIGAGMLALGLLLSIKEPKNKRLTAVEGFVIVALSWLAISIIVAVSFYITGEIGSFIDCLFEAVSGFTTTGATVIGNVEGLSYSTNALRIFTHWVGGMGILVLVLAIIPKNIDATTINVFRAEVPGHQVDKFTGKLALTARILYLIYTALTIVLAIAFIIAKMPVYDSFMHAMSIAGTGGFSVKNASLQAYNSVAIDVIATVGMFVFGANMTLFYLVIIGKLTTVIKSEELRAYAIIALVAMFSMAGCLTANGTYENFGVALRYTSFQTTAIMSTTGMYNANFSLWSMFPQAIIVVLMFIGGCSGSTAGGIKVSRFIIAGKYIGNQISRSARPNRIKTIRLEGERLEESTIVGVMAYFGLYLAVVMVSFVLLCLMNDVFNGTHTMIEMFTSSVAGMSNVGPALGSLAVGTYASYDPVSKLILCFDMLAGRLEILPMLFLFNPTIWVAPRRRKNRKI